MTLFGQYIKERQNKEIIEDSHGFATYFYLQDGVYIEDIFVSSNSRHSGVAASYADQIAKIAKEKGYTKMYGSVVPSSKNSTDSLKVLLAYGFKLESSERNAIIMVKGI